MSETDPFGRTYLPSEVWWALFNLSLSASRALHLLGSHAAEAPKLREDVEKASELVQRYAAQLLSEHPGPHVAAANPARANPKDPPVPLPRGERE